MANNKLESSYKQDYTRYQHYFRNLSRFYQKPVAQVSSALLLTIFTIIFFAAFAIRPTLATIAELIKKIEDQKEVLEDLKKKSAALAVVQNEYTLISDDLPIIKAAIPSEPEADKILYMIEALASKNQLPITSMRLEKIDIDPDGKAEKSKVDSTETSFSLVVEAPYLVLRQLLEEINLLPRLVTIESIKFAPPTNQEDEESSIKLILGLKAYHLPNSYL